MSSPLFVRFLQNQYSFVHLFNLSMNKQEPIFKFETFLMVYNLCNLVFDLAPSFRLFFHFQQPKSEGSSHNHQLSEVNSQSETIHFSESFKQIAHSIAIYNSARSSFIALVPDCFYPYYQCL